MNVISISFIYRFVPQILVQILCFISVGIFVYADYKSGVRKAKELGLEIVSKEIRKTTTKLSSYYMLMLGIAVIDLAQMLSLHVINIESEKHFFVVPILTLVITIVVCYIEFKSIRENADKKQLIKEKEALNDLKSLVEYVLDKKKELN
jgi:Na+/H+ antiporter NhaD/arsenite permease-like protein